MSTARDPVEPGARIASIDALRGLALVGILLMNMVAFGGPIEWPLPLSGAPDLANPDWRIWIAEHMLFEGSMRGLFSMLFGAGMLLFLRETQAGAEADGRTGLFLKRSAWLVVLGVINGTLLLWPGDILLVYGLAAFVVLPFARSSPRRLVQVAAIALAAMSVWAAVDSLTTEPYEPLVRGSKAYLAEQAARLGGYPDLLAYMSELTAAWTFTHYFLWWIVEAAAFMLIGMALFRTGVLSGEATTRTYVLLAVAGFGIALPLNAAETWASWEAGGYDPAWTELTDQAGRTALTLGWLGVFHLTWRSALPRVVFAPLAALGRMALTGYLGQSVICALIFSGFGLGLWDRLSWTQWWLLVIPIMAFEAVFALLWLRAFRFGPVEWLWRSLTYGRQQPMRKI